MNKHLMEQGSETINEYEWSIVEMFSTETIIISTLARLHAANSVDDQLQSNYVLLAITCLGVIVTEIVVFL